MIENGVGGDQEESGRYLCLCVCVCVRGETHTLYFPLPPVDPKYRAE